MYTRGFHRNKSHKLLTTIYFLLTGGIRGDAEHGQWCSEIKIVRSLDRLERSLNSIHFLLLNNKSLIQILKENVHTTINSKKRKMI